VWPKEVSAFEEIDLEMGAVKVYFFDSDAAAADSEHETACGLSVGATMRLSLPQQLSFFLYFSE
jgi:hypothetical protein